MNKFKSIAMALAVAMTLSACASTTTKPKEESKEEAKTEEKATTDISKLTGEYEGTAKGYGGDIKVKVSLENGEIKAIDVEQKETAAVGGAGIERIKEEVIAKNTTDLDNISGATISSAAFLSAVKDAIKKAGADPADLLLRKIKMIGKLKLQQIQ